MTGNVGEGFLNDSKNRGFNIFIKTILRQGIDIVRDGDPGGVGAIGCGVAVVMVSCRVLLVTSLLRRVRVALSALNVLNS